ncbi:MAG TPA: VOC family protein [Burkholderiaceae bacterium]|nr:VOC family protein [Burkholderiaceae bacterium]
MSVLGLFHVAIRSADLDATRAFYAQVLGMVEAERPKLSFPGAWLRAPVAGAPAILHVYAGEAASGSEGAVPSGGAAVDHVSMCVSGFEALRAKVRELGLDWREQCRPGRPYQLFVFDPSGILLELTCDEQAETAPEPTPGKEYRAGWRDWFRPEDYRRFSSGR